LLKKNIDDVEIGDVIICSDGKERTVSKSDIKKNNFMGTTIFGDSWKNGHDLVSVKKVIKWNKGKQV